MQNKLWRCCTELRELEGDGVEVYVGAEEAAGRSGIVEERTSSCNLKQEHYQDTIGEPGLIKQGPSTNQLTQRELH